MLVLGLFAGVAAVAIGVALVRETDSAFGATWASLFVLLGVIVLVSLGTAASGAAPTASAAREVTWEGESARYYPRRPDRARLAGLVVLALLGSWFAVMGVVGAIEENWLWPVLAVVPAVYFLGFPVLAALGRFGSGGMWLSPTRVVDEHNGLRSELTLAAVETVTPRSESVHVTASSSSALTQRALTPWPWRARSRSGDLAATGVATPNIGARAVGDERRSGARYPVLRATAFARDTRQHLPYFLTRSRF